MIRLPKRKPQVAPEVTDTFKDAWRKQRREAYEGWLGQEAFETIVCIHIFFGVVSGIVMSMLWNLDGQDKGGTVLSHEPLGIPALVYLGVALCIKFYKSPRVLLLPNALSPILWLFYIGYKADYMGKRMEEVKKKNTLPVTIGDTPQMRLETYLWYVEYKYGQMAEDLRSRLQSTQRAIESLSGPNPFKDHEFTTKLSNKLQAQSKTMTEMVTTIERKRRELLDEIAGRQGQLREVLHFRDVILAAELADDNERVIGEVRSKLSEIENSVMLRLEQVTADELDTRTKIKTLSEVNSIYPVVEKVTANA